MIRPPEKITSVGFKQNMPICLYACKTWTKCNFLAAILNIQMVKVMANEIEHFFIAHRLPCALSNISNDTKRKHSINPTETFLF